MLLTKLERTLDAYVIEGAAVLNDVIYTRQVAQIATRVFTFCHNILRYY